MENSRNGAVGGGNANGGSDSPSVESWGWEPGDVSSSIHRRPSEESMTSLLQRHSTDVSIGLPAQLQRASTDSLQSRSNIPSLGAPGSSNRHSNGATNSIGLPLPVGGESFLRISSRNSFGSVSDKRGSSKSLGSIEDSLSNDPDFVNWIDSWGHSTDDLDQSSAGDDNDHVAAAAAGALSAIAPSGAPPARGGGRHSLSPDDQSVHPAKVCVVCLFFQSVPSPPFHGAERTVCALSFCRPFPPIPMTLPLNSPFPPPLSSFLCFHVM